MIAAAMCGTIPSVQPNAATTLARRPRERPADSVYSTPVPGVATTISEVSRNAALTRAVLPRRGAVGSRRGPARRAPARDQPRLAEPGVDAEAPRRPGGRRL